MCSIVCSREVWPGREEFGTDGMAPEEELMILRQVCLVELPRKWLFRL